MARYRLSAPAQADIAAILKTSEAQHGADARLRYRALLTAAMRRIAADPQGLSSVARDNLLTGFAASISGIAARTVASCQSQIPCT
jgi:toxin ParE1/3/4